MQLLRWIIPCSCLSPSIASIGLVVGGFNLPSTYLVACKIVIALEKMRFLIIK